MITGESVKKFRQFLGIKQSVVAKKLSITQQAYAKMEKQKVLNEKRFQKVLAALDCNKPEWDDFIVLIDNLSDKLL